MLQVVAVVCVLDRKDGSEFSDNELGLLEELGRVVTSSLEALVIYENSVYKTAVEQSRSSMLLQVQYICPFESADGLLSVGYTQPRHCLIHKTVSHW